MPADRLRLAALCSMAALVVVGCGDSRFLTGRYCSSVPFSVPGVGVSGFADKYLALEIGHYGPDVGGMVGFHEDPNCLQDMNTDDRCPCAHIDAGVFSDDALTFLFDFEYIAEEDCEELGPACVGDDKEQVKNRNCTWGDMTLLAVLKPMEAGEVLEGQLCHTEDCLEGIKLTFERTTTSEKDLEILDKHRIRCEELFFGEGPL